MEGVVGDGTGQALVHVVRLADPDRTVELRAEALPSPDYLIRAAGCSVMAGQVAPSVVEGTTRLAGLPMTAGFTRRVSEALGSRDGAALVLDAAIEVARLARQVARAPRARAEAAVGDPRACWELDRESWVDLPDSCFTYSPAGHALLGTRPVTVPAHADLYSPRPGQARAFVRRKVLRLERVGDRLRLFHSMHDDVHGFELTLEVEAATGRIARAEALTPRLPYMGICSEVQPRIQSLVGETVDAGLRKRLGTLVGGPAGCAQLYDLTSDLLKLLA